jgi:hypothetical protein
VNAKAGICRSMGSMCTDVSLTVIWLGKQGVESTQAAGVASALTCSMEHAVWAVQVIVAVGSVHLIMVWELGDASCAAVLCCGFG